MTLPTQDVSYRIYLTLAQYPILSTEIRAHMRRELYTRGIITPQAFEAEVHEKAIRSQEIEGLHDPLVEEPGDVWETRMARIRDYVTDFYFSYNLPFSLLEEIVRRVLAERGSPIRETLITFNPELAPQRYLFEQGFVIEKLPPEERALAEARLHEIKVVLIRSLISDQLSYVNVAKDWFTLSDLNDIKKRKIGKGKIGGKSAGMLLANRIIQEKGDEALRSSIYIPESFFLGADIMYEFMARNGLMHWLDQKYKPETRIRQEYPELQKEFLSGELPAEPVDRLLRLLTEIDKTPLIVRSSSLLEDNFGTSFAGKYDSYFCPNQASQEENLQSLCETIIRIYASIFNPDAILYRRAKGLLDYDERMAILLQVVQGERYGRYFLPHAAGVGYSRNLYRWSPQIRRDDGFLRLVWGLGTRAVDRTSNDYTRLVALSHPTLRPETDIRAIRHYAQQYVDVLDLHENQFKTLPTHNVLESDYPGLRYIVEMDEGGYLVPLRSTLRNGDNDKLIITMNEMFRRLPLAKMMTSMLQMLEKYYKSPVDTEFTIHISDPDSAKPKFKICVLQCRPQTHSKEDEAKLPRTLHEEDIIFATPRMVPQGHIKLVRYVIFVTPEGYFSLPNPTERADLRQVISKLNTLLEGKNFICVGPGRWGTANPDLGIQVGYGDIYNTRALIELTGQDIGPTPEASYGTHFFQDLIESKIYPLAIYLDDTEAKFNHGFFYDTPNKLKELLPEAGNLSNTLRLIDVASFRPGQTIDIIMDNEDGIAVGFLSGAHE